MGRGGTLAHLKNCVGGQVGHAEAGRRPRCVLLEEQQRVPALVDLKPMKKIQI